MFDVFDLALSPKSIPETAEATGAFTTLLAALRAAQLNGALELEGPYTIFAPDDTAFAGLPEGLVGCLVKPENRDALSQILTYHVVAGKVMSTDLMDGMVATTLNGANVTVDLSSGVKIGTANVTAADVEASNGVIHVINSVLVPPTIDVGAFLATCQEDNMMACRGASGS